MLALVVLGSDYVIYELPRWASSDSSPPALCLPPGSRTQPLGQRPHWAAQAAHARRPGVASQSEEQVSCLKNRNARKENSASLDSRPSHLDSVHDAQPEPQTKLPQVWYGATWLWITPWHISCVSRQRMSSI